MNLLSKIFTGTVVLVVAGCALGPVATPEADVKARAEANWKERISGNFQDAYKYTAPSFREEVNYDQYRSSFGSSVRWVGADVLSIVCEPQKCVAKMSVEVSSPVPHQFSGSLTTRVDEIWVLEGGQWWLLPKR